MDSPAYLFLNVAIGTFGMNYLAHCDAFPSGINAPLKASMLTSRSPETHFTIVSS